ncbi:hypothetical protein ACJX0J_024982 [Zea mays]
MCLVGIETCVMAIINITILWALGQHIFVHVSHMEVAKIVMHKLVLHFACFLYYNCLSQYLKVFFLFYGSFEKSRLFQQQGIATSIGKLLPHQEDNEEEASLFLFELFWD